MFHGFKILFVLALVSCGIDRNRSLRYHPDVSSQANQSLDNQQQNPYPGGHNQSPQGQQQSVQPAVNQIPQVPAETPNGGETIIIGDSIFAFPLGKKVGAFLNEKTSRKIPDYSEAGAVMNPANGDHVKSLPPLVQAILDKRKLIIPNQYMNFVRPNHKTIKTIVMDGGGNDIFSNEATCLRMGCDRVYQGVESTLQQLFNKMASDGVENIVYLGYYNLKGGKANLNNVVSQGNQRLKAACDRSPVRCIFIDTKNLISPGQIILDGIHPSPEGSEILAGAIYNVLKQI